MSQAIEDYARLASEHGGRLVSERDLLTIIVPADKLRDAADKLFNAMGLDYRTCVGVDERVLNNRFSLIHLFTDNKRGLYIALKTFLDPENPTAYTISDIIPAADWCELEAWDLLGIRFEGRKLKRLVLPEWWPQGQYPLRKDFDYNKRPDLSIARSEKVGSGAEAGVIPVGPYHPALHEPEYFELYVKGEKVVDVNYRGFHVHRGIEKLAESRMNYQQVNFLAERICGICGFEHSTCYALAVEKAAGIEVPERAQFIRSIVLEIERIHSHLLWLGVAFHLLGYDAGFMHLWRVRERVMVLAELLTGSRKTYGINLIGGVRRDISEEKKSRVLNELGEVAKDFRRIVDIALSAPYVKKRLTGTGVLPKEDARRLGVEGPVARASGIDKDARRDLPYAAYKHAYFKVPVYTEGDNMARTMVRVEEVFESISIIEQLLDKIPKGPLLAEKIDIPPGRVGVQVVEAPRGGDIHFVITGDGRPYRWRVRAPTYNNIPALKIMLRGQYLADAPITIASIDPCFSCTDRVLVVRDGVVEKLDLGVTL
ncbi:hydrogenase large subunit [Thermogladius sp. 4427co]|uniref:hydrogenase large subunit n=1 Tax=Thermogladius sp. 4427co TaxID=3450718 RepID=UPI003F7A3EE6